MRRCVLHPDLLYLDERGAAGLRSLFVQSSCQPGRKSAGVIVQIQREDVDVAHA